jgi:hypothetical protein
VRYLRFEESIKTTGMFDESQRYANT